MLKRLPPVWCQPRLMIKEIRNITGAVQRVKRHQLEKTASGSLKVRREKNRMKGKKRDDL